jgi:hypothetical protein
MEKVSTFLEKEVSMEGAKAHWHQRLQQFCSTLRLSSCDNQKSIETSFKEGGWVSILACAPSE